MTWAAQGHAETKPPPSAHVAIGFSNLVARIDDDEIGFAKAEYRVHILEAMRDAGFNAVGAESLVFNRDNSEEADLLLGGTVKELACTGKSAKLRCSVGIEWQLLSRESDEVVYRVLSRFAALDLPKNNNAAAGKTLLLGALKRLLTRPRFKQLALAEHAPHLADESFEPATYHACEAVPSELPRDFERVAESTVLLKSGKALGSGFYLGSDGLLLTAAHVIIANKVEVHTRGGQTLPAHVVRLSRQRDVALLALDNPSPRPCLAIESTPQATGADVYAIGAPAGEELAFSMSRGIVSGLRTIADVPLIQTDASLNPGNSGGALLDKQGRIIGVVSRKLAGHALEGLGFAIPIQTALDALKVLPSTATTPTLTAAAPSKTPSSNDQIGVADAPDPRPSLDPEGDRRRAEEKDYEKRVSERDAQTPSYVRPMRWAGLGVAIAGSIGVIATYSGRKEEMTRSDYESLRTWNDVSWVAAGLGLGTAITSLFLTPSLSPAKVGNAPRWSVAAGPTAIQLHVSMP